MHSKCRGRASYRDHVAVFATMLRDAKAMQHVTPMPSYTLARDGCGHC